MKRIIPTRLCIAIVLATIAALLSASFCSAAGNNPDRRQAVAGQKVYHKAVASAEAETREYLRRLVGNTPTQSPTPHPRPRPAPKKKDGEHKKEEEHHSGDGGGGAGGGSESTRKYSGGGNHANTHVTSASGGGSSSGGAASVSSASGGGGGGSSSGGGSSGGGSSGGGATSVSITSGGGGGGGSSSSGGSSGGGATSVSSGGGGSSSGGAETSAGGSGGGSSGGGGGGSSVGGGSGGSLSVGGTDSIFNPSDSDGSSVNIPPGQSVPHGDSKSLFTLLTLGIGVGFLVAGAAFSRQREFADRELAPNHNHRLKGSVKQRMSMFGHMVELSDRQGSGMSGRSAGSGEGFEVKGTPSSDDLGESKSTKSKASLGSRLSKAARKKLVRQLSKTKSVRQKSIENDISMDVYSRTSNDGGASLGSGMMVV